MTTQQNLSELIRELKDIHESIYGDDPSTISAVSKAAALLAADARGGEAVAHLDAMLTKILNRRVVVEQELFDMAAGKKPMPDAAKLRELALRLGDPAHTHPHPHLQPERVPLTDEQLHQMRVDAKASKEVCNEHWFILFARAIEAAHHIGKPAQVGPLEDCHGVVAGK